MCFSSKRAQNRCFLFWASLLHTTILKKLKFYTNNAQNTGKTGVGIVKSTSPDTESDDKNGYAKVYDDNNIFMTNVDKNDTTYTNKHKNTDMRDTDE